MGLLYVGDFFGGPKSFKLNEIIKYQYGIFSEIIRRLMTSAETPNCLHT